MSTIKTFDLWESLQATDEWSRYAVASSEGSESSPASTWSSKKRKLSTTMCSNTYYSPVSSCFHLEFRTALRSYHLRTYIGTTYIKGWLGSHSHFCNSYSLHLHKEGKFWEKRSIRQFRLYTSTLAICVFFYAISCFACFDILSFLDRDIFNPFIFHW